METTEIIEQLEYLHCKAEAKLAHAKDIHEEGRWCKVLNRIEHTVNALRDCLH